MTEYRFTGEKGERLDVFLAKRLEGVSRSRIKAVCDDGGATVGGKSQRAGYALHGGEEIVFTLPCVKTIDAKPEEIPLDIVYEDDAIAVINKPQGMVVHPAVGSYEHTLVNALLYNLSSLSGINGVIRPGIVHRLDKDTSGLLVVAKTDDAHKKLSAQIAKKGRKKGAISRWWTAMFATTWAL
jgi:Pseudouridylate synthases, 23S RNA-specific